MRGPDAPWDAQPRAEIVLPERRPRWSTPDAAVLAAVPFEIGPRAICYEPRVAGGEQEALQIHADKTEVLCALSALGFWERKLVEGYAHLRFCHQRTNGPRARDRERAAYAALLDVVVRGRGPWTTTRDVRRAHVAARAYVLGRLVESGVCER